MAVKKFRLNEHDKMLQKIGRKRITLIMKITYYPIVFRKWRNLERKPRPKWHLIHGKPEQAKEIRL